MLRARALARGAPLPETPGTAAGRDGTDNPSYGIADAAMCQAMLRHLRPRHYLEDHQSVTARIAALTERRDDATT